MAFLADRLPNGYGQNVTGNYVVISSFQELQKNCLVINVGVFMSKQEYTSLRPSVEHLRFLVNPDDLDTSANIRTGIYKWLTTQPEFSNVVADADSAMTAPPIPT